MMSKGGVGLERDFNVNRTLAINGILVQIRGGNVQLGESVHITTAFFKFYYKDQQVKKN